MYDLDYPYSYICPRSLPGSTTSLVGTHAIESRLRYNRVSSKVVKSNTIEGLHMAASAILSKEMAAVGVISKSLKPVPNTRIQFRY